MKSTLSVDDENAALADHVTCCNGNERFRKHVVGHDTKTPGLVVTT